MPSRAVPLLLEVLGRAKPLIRRGVGRRTEPTNIGRLQDSTLAVEVVPKWCRIIRGVTPQERRSNNDRFSVAETWTAVVLTNLNPSL